MIKVLVRERGLEPPRPKTHAPQACLATKLQHSRLDSTNKKWWVMRDSNPRPSVCKTDALAN